MPPPSGVRVASLTRRAIAALVDGAAPYVLGCIAAVVLTQRVSTVAAAMVVGVTGLLVVAWWLFVWWSYATRGVGPGYRLMGLRLLGVDDGRPVGWTRLLLRQLVLGAAAATGIGFVVLVVLMARDGRRQGLHDRVARSLAVTSPNSAERVAPAPPMPPLPDPSRPQTVPPGVTAGRGVVGDAQRSGWAPVVAVPASDAASSKAAVLVQPAPAAPTPAAPGQHPISASSGAVPSGWTPPPPPGHRSDVGGHQTVLAGEQSGPATAASTGAAIVGAPSESPAVSSGAADDSPRRMEVLPSPEHWGAAVPPPVTRRLGGGAAAPVSGGGQPCSGPAAQPIRGAAPDDPEFDRTHLATAHGAGVWYLVLDDGRQVPVRGTVVVGRQPVAPAEAPGAVVVGVGEDRAVSKTHLSVVVGDNVLLVTDRGSTNGTAVVSHTGALEPCPAHAPVKVADGQVVSFGNHAFTVRRRLR